MALKDNASLALIPAAYKTSKVYSAIPTNGDGDFTFSRSGTGATRINKAGLVETMGANVPRLNYDLTNGTPASCPHLLLEPTRTNYLLNSNDASQWDTFTSNGTITRDDNYSIAPDGTLTATRLQASVTGSGYALLFPRTFTLTSGSYSLSVYIKSNTQSNQEVAFYGLGTTVTNYTITDEWQRLELTGTASGQAYILLGILTDNAGYTNPIDVSVWGGQLEAGSYATSLIPTTTAAVTRTRDTAKIEPYTALPSDYPLTVFWEGKIDNYNAGQFVFSIFGSGINSKYLGFAWQSSIRFYLYRRSSTNNDADLVSFSSNQDTNYKVAVSFISNTEAKVYINGSLAYNLTSGLDIDYEFDSVLIGQQRVVSDNGFRNSAKQFMIFNEALTDAELTTLTT